MKTANAWPLVARESELALIDAALATDQPCVVLVGEAGVGKTRLARDALARWAARGGEVEWVVATRAAAAIPFSAVSSLLPADVLAGGDPAALPGNLARRLGARGGGRLAVAVDDAHLLDESSAGLLHQLVVRRAVALVVTVRTGDPTSDAVLAMWKDVGTRLAVRPLPVPAMDRLLDEALGGEIEAVTRHRLRRLANGNVLLLRELLEDGVHSGVLAEREGVWCWRGEVPADARMADLVAARLHGLDAEVRELLEIVACGEPLPLPVVEQLADAAVIDAAESSGMLASHCVGVRVTLRLAHPLFGEVLRRALPVSRARAVWGRLAAASAKRPDGLRRDDDVLRAGIWQMQAGLYDQPDVLLAAARRAMAGADLALAERLARAAGQAAVDGSAHWLLARILQLRGRGPEAAAVVSGARAPAANSLPMSAVTRAGVLYWGSGEAEHARRLLGSVGSADLTDATRAWILVLDGRGRSASRVASAVLDRPGADDQAVVWASMACATAAGLLGHAAQASAAGRRGARAARSRPDQLSWGLAQLGYATCLAELATGRLHASAETAHDGYQAAVAADARPMAAVWAALRGIVAKEQGRPADAQRALREAIAAFGDEDTYRLVPLCLAELAGAAATAGDATRAREWLSRADTGKVGANRLFQAWIERDRAWVEAADSSQSRALDSLRRAGELARRTQQPTIEARCLYDIARLGEPGEVVPRLRVLAGAVEGDFVTALASAAAALDADDLAGLEKVAAILHDLGATLLASEALAAAGRGSLRRGQAARGRALAGRAAAMAGACQGARTPLLDVRTTVLTRREREIAVLATSLPSRAIGERLGLSVYTVNNTLARAYAKLGVSGRRELEHLLATDLSAVE